MIGVILRPAWARQLLLKNQRGKKKKTPQISRTDNRQRLKFMLFIQHLTSNKAIVNSYCSTQTGKCDLQLARLT